MPSTVLITGANRGLGLAFTRLFLEKGFTVIAGTRNPKQSAALTALQNSSKDRLHIVALDTNSEESIHAARVATESFTKSIDILINNAGQFGKQKSTTLTDLDIGDIQKTFETNALGPLRVTRDFLGLLRKGSEKKVIQITSLMGSIADNSSGGAYAYRLSKAALNMLTKNIAVELQSDGMISVALHPGWVKTDMGGPQAPLDIDTSVKGMMNVIERLTLKDSGTFLRYDGTSAPW